MVVTLGQEYNVGEKPTVMLYTYINRHAGTPDKRKKKLCSHPTQGENVKTLLFLTFSVLGADPMNLLYTVANPACGLLNREKKKKKKDLAAPPPSPSRAARSEKIK